jgi:hypothetical protein
VTCTPPTAGTCARSDGRLQRGRHTHLSDLFHRYVCAELSLQHTTLGQFAHDFFGEKRITGGVCVLQ